MEMALPVVGIVVLVVLFAAVINRYRRCPSDKILVIYGGSGSKKSAKCVHGGGAFVRLADAVIFACVEQDPLGSCRFSGIDMSHNTDVPDSVKWMASGHTGQLLLSTAA